MASWRRLVVAGLALILVAVHAAAGEKGAGTENRQWVAGAKAAPVSPAVYGFTEQEQFVAMRDGVRLQTRIFLPVLPEGAATPPCVLETNGYGAPLDPFFVPGLQDLAKRGYPVVFARLRGTAPSEGVSDLYNRFGEDGHDLIEWMARQPWCNGDVGMVGGSLDTAREVILAGVGSGSGAYTQNLPVNLDIPAQSQTGTYIATLTIAITSGP